MANLVRPVLYSSLAGLAVWALVLHRSDPPTVAKAAPVKKKESSAKVDTDFTKEDYSAHFDKPKGSGRNLFHPLISTVPTTVAVATEAPKDIDRIPADLANGEGDWIFTGIASVDGQDMALLENRTTKQGGFVKTGEVWKGTRIVRVSAQSVTVLTKAGAPQVVLRFNPDAKPAGSPGATTGMLGAPGAPNPLSPMNPGQGMPPGVPSFSGPIGPMRFSPAPNVVIIND